MIFLLFTSLITDVLSLRISPSPKCPIPRQIPNASYQFTYPSVVQYSCDPGYQFVGSSTGTVAVDCQRTDTAPNCEATPCSLVSVPANTITSSSLIGSTFTMGANVTLPCVDGFTADGLVAGPKSVTLMCGANGAMLPSSMFLDSCKPINCGRPPVVQNAERLPGQMSLAQYYEAPEGSGSTAPLFGAGSAVFGDSIEYACNANYTLNGALSGSTNFRVNCQADGTFTSPPTCQMVNCGPVPSYPNSSPVASEAAPLGGSVQYACFPGTAIQLPSGGARLTSFSVACGWDPITQTVHYDTPKQTCQ